jgi:hypothetical protein
MGFSMLLYPTTVLFQVAAAVRSALVRLSHGQAMTTGYTLEEFEELLGIEAWRTIEKTFGGGNYVRI